MSEAKFVQMYVALKRIMAYQKPDQLRRNSQRDWGVPYEEALEYVYENVRDEAAQGLKGVRLPKPKAVKS